MTRRVMWVLLAGVALALAGDQVLFQDGFANYVLSSGAPNWLIHSGKWEFKDGVVRQIDPKANGALLFLDGKSFSDVRLKVRFHPDGGASQVRAAGLVFRAKDSLTYYWVHFDVRNSQVVLARRTPEKGWIIVRRAGGVQIAPGVWHVGEVTAVGQKMSVKLDGKAILTAEDGALSAGRVGLRTGMGIIGFDDFEVSGQPADDSKFVRHTAPPEDGKTRRLAVPRVVSSRDCGYFPVLLHLGGQKLGAVIRAGAPHVGIGGRLDWICSEDGGKSWSQPSVIVDSRHDDRNPAAMLTRDGRIIVIYSEASTYNEKGEYNPKYGTFSLFLTESADGGKTWSPKRPLVFEGYQTQCVYGQGITLANGDLLVPWYTGKTVGGFIRSKDGGRTWRQPKVIGPCCEIAFAEVAPKEIVAAGRTKSGCLILRSTDNGETWSKPERLTPKGMHPATLIRLADGRLFLAYSCRIRPFGIKVALSLDNGKNWKEENSAYISWDSSNGDSGYPSAVQLADGSVVVVSYAVGSGMLPEAIQSQCAILSPESLNQLGAAAPIVTKP